MYMYMYYSRPSHIRTSVSRGLDYPDCIYLCLNHRLIYMYSLDMAQKWLLCHFRYGVCYVTVLLIIKNALFPCSYKSELDGAGECLVLMMEQSSKEVMGTTCIHTLAQQCPILFLDPVLRSVHV